MAKRGQPIAVVSSRLVIEKEEFKSKINDRIFKGRGLLDYPVKQLATRTDSFGHSYGEYDKEEQSNFLTEYNKWKQFNIELLKRSFNIPDNEYLREYENAVRDSVWSDWVAERKQAVKEQITVLESLIERLSLINSTEEIIKTSDRVEKKITNKIFVVHGHNNELKQIVARTISQLKLEPIILHEQAEQGRTIIEKFEKNSSDANFAIILLTADDEGKSIKESDFKARARQNVVFEMGYFIGKLGRDKVFLLLEHGVDKPGDLDGIIYVPIDNSDGWKLKLVKELKLAGYNVSADNL
jgi:predicted nucleotide-binding protein